MSRVKTLDLTQIRGGDPNSIARQISESWYRWNASRQTWLNEKEEIRQYIFATDTRKITKGANAWKNSTTVPKICQIRDNLHANYMAALFPKRKWMEWLADDEESATIDKKSSVEQYMMWAVGVSEFTQTINKIILDYIDYGNCFATAEWVEVKVANGETVSYPKAVRINPLDIVFDPTAASFMDTPKIVRQLMTLGELKKRILQEGPSHEKEQAEAIFARLLDTRKSVREITTSAGRVNHTKLDSYYRVDGFDSYFDYLNSNYVEVLVFHGDLYDVDNDVFYENHEMVVIDKDYLVWNRPEPSFFGKAPIFHAGWRTRQDNLWSMGPLDNLIGMQYRIDHIENCKADLMDFTVFPVQKVRGQVYDYVWEPGAQIHVGDDGDVDIHQPDAQWANLNFEIESYMAKMEELAGAPKEAMGFRTPGEKTKYEVQRLENAANRIFTNKIKQFEIDMIHSLLNAMLELARRNITTTTIRVFNDELKINTFTSLTQADITGAGKIRPIGAQNFAEKAEIIQNLSGFYGSAVGADPLIRSHFSGFRIAKMMEDLLDIESFKVVQKNIRFSEEIEAQMEVQALQEGAADEMETPAGISPDDFDEQLPL